MSEHDQTSSNGSARTGSGANLSKDRLPDELIGGVSSGATGLAEMPVEESRRAASVRLRGDDIRQVRAASLEAANRSLAEALDIVYRLIIVVMVGLVAMFLLSGFQQVRESEVGVKVAFGAITNAGIEPGFTPSLPRPFGEIIRINTAPVTLELTGAGERNTDFWPQVANPLQPLENQATLAALRPGRDGSLITADGNIVHAQFTVNYRRSEFSNYLRNVYEATDSDRLRVESELVRRAVMRGAVKTVAQLSIDDILRRGALTTEGDTERVVGFDPIVLDIQREAQQTLDTLETGLAITSVQIRAVSPPGRVINDFKAVNNAVSEASQRIEQARTEASQTLNQAAGAASQPAIALIRRYEAQVDAGETQQAEATLQMLRELFDGTLAERAEPITVGETTYDSLSVGGRVSQTIASARQEADTRTSRARSAARTFEANLAAYRANPRVFMATRWTSAMLAFMNNNMVEVFILPDGTKNMRLSINTDPEILRRLERAEFEQRMRENPRFREAMRAGELNP